MHKPFDRDMFEKVDSLAREATKKYISSRGYEAIDNPNKYGADLIVEGVCYVECECKLVWDSLNFPYKTIHLPTRKEKFTKLDMPCCFFIWNKQFSSAIKFTSSDVLKSPKKEVPNKEIKSGEYFFDLDVNKLEQIYA